MNNLWNQVSTENGEIYYHNLNTNQTSWYLPSDAILVNQTNIPIAQIVSPAYQYYTDKAPSKELRQQRLKKARKNYCFTFW